MTGSRRRRGRLAAAIATGGAALALSTQPAAAEIYNFKTFNVAFPTNCLVTLSQYSERNAQGEEVTGWAMTNEYASDCQMLKVTVYTDLFGTTHSNTRFTFGSTTGYVGQYGNLYASRHFARNGPGSACRQWEISPFSAGVTIINDSCS